MRMLLVMSDAHDPFLPKSEPEVSLELGEGFEGSGRNRRTTAPPGVAVTPRRPSRTQAVEASASQSIPFGTLVDPSASARHAAPALDVDRGHPSAQNKRATLSPHSDFIAKTNTKLGVSQSFAEKHAESHRLYWRLTRFPILLLLGWFTISHLLLDASWVFIDNVNLTFHEAGHPLFRWAGDTVYFLGGTLGQLLIPALMAGYFFFKQRQRFATLVCVWWIGENLMGIARYMDDAPVMELPLVGGDTHDWNYLFTKWGALNKARDVAELVHLAGVVIMVGTLAYLLWISLRPTEDELAEGFRA